MDKYLLSDYTTYELQGYIHKRDPVTIIPIGALEQHGAHLPLDTDMDLVERVARYLAKNCAQDILITPTVWMGFSHHHLDFCGTISIRQKTMVYIITDIVESLLNHNINKIILLNGHGGNTAILKTILDEIQFKYKDISMVYFTYWDLLSDEIDAVRKSPLNGMAHAGELETSLKYYFAEKDVRKDSIKDVMLPANSFHNVDMFAPNKISVYKPFKKYSEGGQIGKPSIANKETGQKIVEILSKEFNYLVNLVF
ncbi:creatininase family protein [Virgibacillus oceani]